MEKTKQRCPSAIGTQLIISGVLLPDAKNNLCSAGKWCSYKNEKNGWETKIYIKMVYKSKYVDTSNIWKKNIVTIMEIKGNTIFSSTKKKNKKERKQMVSV